MRRVLFLVGLIVPVGCWVMASLKPAEQPAGQRKEIIGEFHFIDVWGHAELGTGGFHYHHDILKPGLTAEDPFSSLPKDFWGAYPLYYANEKMRYQIVLKNVSSRSHRDLKIIASPLYLTREGHWKKLGANSMSKEWLIDYLEKDQQIVVTGEVKMPPHFIRPGISRIEWTITQASPGKDGMAVLAQDADMAIWCPKPF